MRKRRVEWGCHTEFWGQTDLAFKAFTMRQATSFFFFFFFLGHIFCYPLPHVRGRSRVPVGSSLPFSGNPHCPESAARGQKRKNGNFLKPGNGQLGRWSGGQRGPSSPGTCRPFPGPAAERDGVLTPLWSVCHRSPPGLVLLTFLPSLCRANQLLFHSVLKDLLRAPAKCPALSE